MCRSNFQAIKERGRFLSSSHNVDDIDQPTQGVILRTKSYGQYTFIPRHVFSCVAEAAAHQETWDYVVVTTKALPDVSDDSEIIVPVVTSGKSCIVLIQNGVSTRYTHCLNVSYLFLLFLYLFPGRSRSALSQTVSQRCYCSRLSVHVVLDFQKVRFYQPSPSSRQRKLLRASS